MGELSWVNYMLTDLLIMIFIEISITNRVITI